VENDGELKAYTVDDALFLDVVADGNYSVSVYDLNGRTIASKTQEVAAGSYMRVTLNGASGVYVVNVLRDGVKAKSFKVIKK
ncbi:MAG TPA: T9SS type A sorting domain-containing protein, partial [Muribaculaceae bacterium]|nr:T9SS type A sorting domain-containing protein [Muribaculaceae bacterium]